LAAAGGLLPLGRLRRLAGPFLRFFLRLPGLLLELAVQGFGVKGFRGLVGVLHQGRGLRLVLGERLLQLTGAVLFGHFATLEGVLVPKGRVYTISI